MTAQKLFETKEEIRKFKCKGCEETLYEELDTGSFYTDAKRTDEVYCQYSELLEDWVCQGCYESDQEHSSTLVRFAPDETETVKFGEYIAYGVEYGDVPEWFWDYFDKREWKSTDAWRGYYQTTFKNGFVKLADGWVTGYPDETTKRKLKASDLYEFLQKRENAETLPAPIYWLFEPTSNVFSTASEIFYDEKDGQALKEWLRANDFDEEDIKYAFS